MIEGRCFAAASIVGARDRQEDDWGVHAAPPVAEEGAVLLAAVADGMGGAPAGDQASRIVVKSFMDRCRHGREPADERLRSALLAANDDIQAAAAADGALDGMGATLVAALFLPGRCAWLSVGDSHILLFRGGRISRVNPLHTLGQLLDAQAERGEITREAALSHSARRRLTSVVMGLPIEEVAQGDLALQQGDAVLLASDGVDSLTHESMAEACAQGVASAPEEVQAQWIADSLLDRIEARAEPRQDNATIIVVIPIEGAAAAQEEQPA